MVDTLVRHYIPTIAVVGLVVVAVKLITVVLPEPAGSAVLGALMLDMFYAFSWYSFFGLSNVVTRGDNPKRVVENAATHRRREHG